MVSHAIDDVEDAFAATKAFLLPFDLGRWLRLTVITLFVASANGASGAGSSVSSLGPFTGTVEGPPGGIRDGSPGFENVPPGFEGLERFVTANAPLDTELFALAVALVVIALVIGLVFALLSAIMQFVMVESLRTESVHVRRYVRRFISQGLRLFGFQIAVGLSLAAGIGLLVGLVAVPVLVLESPVIAVVAALVAVPLLLVTVFAGLAVLGFTNAFVVPTMIAEECGILDGWRRFWPVFRADWDEYLAFALVYVVLFFLAGIVVSIAVAIAAVILLIPFGLLGLVVFAIGSAAEPVGLALGAILVVLYFLSVLAIVAFVQVPVVTYFKYYGLFVLGDTEPDLDVIGNRRRAVRDGADGDAASLTG